MSVWWEIERRTEQEREEWNESKQKHNKKVIEIKILKWIDGLKIN